MGTYTMADLAQRALQRLGGVGDGNEAAPEDAKKVRDALPAILSALDADGILDYPPDDDVPPWAMDGLTAIVASRLSDDFGLQQNDIITLASRAQAAEATLRRLGYSPWSAGRSHPSYF